MVCKDLRLKSRCGASTDGDAIRVRAIARLRQFGSNLETRVRLQRRIGGQAFQMSSCPGSPCVNFQAGTTGSNPAAPAHHAADRQTGKSLQWIERLKRSPSLN